MCGRAVMHNARPSLFIFAVLSAVLRSGFRDTPVCRLGSAFALQRTEPDSIHFYKRACNSVTTPPVTQTYCPSLKSEEVEYDLQWRRNQLKSGTAQQRAPPLSSRPLSSHLPSPLLLFPSPFSSPLPLPLSSPPLPLELGTLKYS